MTILINKEVIIFEKMLNMTFILGNSWADNGFFDWFLKNWFAKNFLMKTFGVRIIEVRIIEVRITEDVLYWARAEIAYKKMRVTPWEH